MPLDIKEDRTVAVPPSLQRSRCRPIVPGMKPVSPSEPRFGRLRAALLAAVVLTLAGSARSTVAQTTPPAPRAERFSVNPLLTVESSPSLGGNVNGPTVIRVPDWVENPLGRYYMYFANHMGEFVRLAYADTLTGPWRIHEPGVLHVRETALYRLQPDPPGPRADFYTHVASPEIFVDHERQRLLMWFHGWWTNGERWPDTLPAARAWAREHGYGQFTQVAESADGLQFTARPTITRTSYLRVFEQGDHLYGVSRLGVVSRSADPLAEFQLGLSLFRDGPYAGKLRHLALVPRDDELLVFFTAIGDAPERVLMSTVSLIGDWTTWRASEAIEVLRPEATYECVDLPNLPSEGGDIDVPAQQIRDPFVFEEDGRAYLFYATCGEQGIAGARLELP